MIDRKIAVVGLGYVGLPVAVFFGKKCNVIGFDINQKRIEELRTNFDRNLEVDYSDLKTTNVTYTNDLSLLKEASFYIVTVPTPVGDGNLPDLRLVQLASESIGRVLKNGDIVVYESTVYPGVTEDVCVPILEKISGLKLGVNFGVGYSPERINPGDKEHTFEKIRKVVSGSDKKTLDIISKTYSSVVKAGVFEAATIRVAEAAKVIENSQRDINIAFMNELSLIFEKMNINTSDVLEAASTKWNFLNFYPGLVGGHCIGVDPYYLTHKAEVLGYHPQVILAGRRINDNMGYFIASKVLKMLSAKRVNLCQSIVTILGLTFKENTPDIRNSKVVDIIKELKEFGVNVQVVDPLALEDEVELEYGLNLTDPTKLQKADCLILAVSHDEFKKYSAEQVVEKYLKGNDSVVVGVRSHLKKSDFEKYNIRNWFI